MAGNRRVHFGVLQIYAGGFDICCGFALGGDCIVILLAADGLRIDQRFVAAGGGIGAFPGCHRAIKCGLIGRRINLIKLLTGFDFTAFNKKTFLDHAVHLRTDFCTANRRGAAGQAGGQGDGLAVQSDDIDRRHLCRRGCRTGGTITCRKQYDSTDRKKLQAHRIHSYWGIENNHSQQVLHYTRAPEFAV